MRKKICCLTCDFLRKQSYSINYHLLLLFKNYSEHFDIHIFSYDPMPNTTVDEVFNNLNCSEYSDKISFHRMENLHTSKWGQEISSFDIIYSQMYIFADVLEQAKKINKNIKLISWIHSIVTEEYLASIQKNIFQMQYLFRQQNKLVNLSDRCIFDSHMDLQRGLLNFSDIQQKSCVIYPVSEVDGIYHKKDDRGSIDVSSIEKTSDISLIFVGRWDYRKGIELLIPCSFRLFVEHGIRTVILSDYEMSNNSLGIFSNITVLNQFKHLMDADGIQMEKWKSDRNEYLSFLAKQLRIAVLPSTYDPFNIVAYDCATIGVPLILSNRCGAAEILNQGDALSYCNPLNTESLYEKILSMCRTVVNKRNIPPVCIDETYKMHIEFNDILNEIQEQAT